MEADTDGCTRPKRRIVTPARREQNRLAQKGYRQRQKVEKQHRRNLANSSRRRNLKPSILRPQEERAPEPDYPSSIQARLPLAEGPLHPTSKGTDLATHIGESQQVNDLVRTSTGLENDLLLSECLDLISRQPNSVDWSHMNAPVHHSSAPVLPDAYANCIQLPRTATLTAAFTNAIVLQFDLSRMMDLNYISPFYNPCVSLSADPTAVSDPSIPPHLRPTLPQILFAHHASIDLIPLPELRARAILFSVSMAGMFDLMALKKDAFYRGGLVCWSGPSWDMRSWEAPKWFLSKWRAVVDGEDGELWKSSAWWRTLRGEE